ncbi:MAG: hypothetical protein V6Z86_09320, partial [Hyphomicrobiales bacterium]
GSDGRLSADWADAHRMACSLEPFTVMTALRAFYRKRLSKTQTDRIIADLREGCSFSNHIVDKAADFIKSGKIYFKREAQFPPTSIRRPLAYSHADQIRVNEKPGARLTIAPCEVAHRFHNYLKRIQLED